MGRSTVGAKYARRSAALFLLATAMSQFVKDFYNARADLEWKRLDLPLCRIEFASTLRLIEKYFPKQGRVCDVGSGPGRYAIELIGEVTRSRSSTCRMRRFGSPARDSMSQDSPRSG